MAPRRFASVLTVLLTGCGSLVADGAQLDDLVAIVRGEDSAQRQAATGELLRKDPVSMRYLVVPRLALESAMTPIQVTSNTGGIFKGRVTGGDDRTLELQTTKHVAEGALIEIPVAEIKVLRLFPR